MIDVRLMCNSCKTLQEISFVNKKQLDECYHSWNLVELCLICKVSEYIDKYIGASLLSIDCMDKGKYLFTIDDRSKKMYGIIGYSTRMNRKHKQAIFLQLETLNIVNSYLLLASYLETSYVTIKHTYQTIKKNHRTIGRFVEIKQNYINIPDINFKEYNEITFFGDDNFFINNNLKAPRYIHVANFIRHVANILKHCDGTVHDSRSGKHLIENYGLRENSQIIDYMWCNIKNTRPKTSVGNLPAIASMMYIFLKDFISIAFSCPKIQEKKLDYENIWLKLLHIKYRKKIINTLMKDLQKEAIVLFPLEEEIIKKYNKSRRFSKKHKLKKISN